jgi:polyhydroxybutyrate depolymerase
MKTGTILIRAVLVIGLPAVFALAASASHYFLNQTSGAILSSGRYREYLLHVPHNYDGSKPTPLVISMHGGGAWPGHQMSLSRWNRLADQHGFIVVYPAGSGRPRSWHVDRGTRLMTDVQYISDLIDTLEASYNIDQTRIYANGLSNGAGMSFVLSCTLSNRIAAVGMVAAAHSLPWNWCTDHQPMPMIAFHGTADMLTPYNGGLSPAFPKSVVMPNIPTFTANWARRNQCGTNPIESIVSADVTRLEYTNCASNAAVVLYTIDGGGHTWPGGRPISESLAGFTTNSIDATSRMWAFFQKHQLK